MQKERKRARVVLFDGGRALDMGVSIHQMGEDYVTYIVIVKFKDKCRLRMVFLDLEWIEGKGVDLRLICEKLLASFGPWSQPYEEDASEEFRVSTLNMESISLSKGMGSMLGSTQEA